MKTSPGCARAWSPLQSLENSLENPSTGLTRPTQSARLKSDLILLLVAIVWGSGFVAQRFASHHLGFLVPHEAPPTASSRETFAADA